MKIGFAEAIMGVKLLLPIVITVVGTAWSRMDCLEARCAGGDCFVCVNCIGLNCFGK